LIEQFFLPRAAPQEYGFRNETDKSSKRRAKDEKTTVIYRKTDSNNRLSGKPDWLETNQNRYSKKETGMPNQGPTHPLGDANPHKVGQHEPPHHTDKDEVEPEKTDSHIWLAALHAGTPCCAQPSPDGAN
jgi:hypothetical protein